MTPLLVIELTNNAVKLAILLTEAKPPEQRAAESLLGFRILYRLVKPWLGEDLRSEIEELMSAASSRSRTS